jgi:sulfate adenylyltransferase subunit 1 (EFTu-like GTPase family)
MDLVGFSPERFAEIEGELRALAAELGIEELTCIPVCAVDGDNVVRPSERTPWYEARPCSATSRPSR